MQPSLLTSLKWTQALLSRNVQTGSAPEVEIQSPPPLPEPNAVLAPSAMTATTATAAMSVAAESPIAMMRRLPEKRNVLRDISGLPSPRCVNAPTLVEMTWTATCGFQFCPQGRLLTSADNTCDILWSLARSVCLSSHSFWRCQPLIKHICY